MRGIMSKLYQIITIVVFIVVFISCSSSLRQNNRASIQGSEKQVQEVKQEWLECKVNADCIKVRSFCKLPAVVHKKYKSDFLIFVKQSHKNPIDCSRYKNINYASIVEAACENKQCKLIIP